MPYKVIRGFTDLQDNNRPYGVGDTFPHAKGGYPVTEKRLAELASCDNKQGAPLIQAVEQVKRVKKTAAK